MKKLTLIKILLVLGFIVSGLLIYFGHQIIEEHWLVTDEAEKINEKGLEVYNEFINNVIETTSAEIIPVETDENGTIINVNLGIQEGKGFIEALRKKYNNEEVVGYLVIEDYNIYTPILYKDGDVQYYLRHNAYGEYSYNGSVFLDSGCAPDFIYAGNIVYGHNMLDGQMFGRLEKCVNDLGIDDVKVVIYTDSERLVYEVLAAGPLTSMDRQELLAKEEPEDGYFANLYKEKYGYTLQKEYPSYLTLITCYYKDSSKPRYGLTCGLVLRDKYE